MLPHSRLHHSHPHNGEPHHLCCLFPWRGIIPYHENTSTLFPLLFLQQACLKVHFSVAKRTTAERTNSGTSMESVTMRLSSHGRYHSSLPRRKAVSSFSPTTVPGGSPASISVSHVLNLSRSQMTVVFSPRRPHQRRRCVSE